MQTGSSCVQTPASLNRSWHLGIPGRYRRAHLKWGFNCRVQNSLLKLVMPVTESGVGGRQRVLLSCEVSGYLGDPWFVSPFGSWNSCCLSCWSFSGWAETPGCAEHQLQTKESKGGHLSRVGTRGPVSRRKCSGNHRLSTDHRLRSTTSWAINLSPGWTSNTSILQGRKDTGQASLPHGTHQTAHSFPLIEFSVHPRTLQCRKLPWLA